MVATRRNSETKDAVAALMMLWLSDPLVELSPPCDTPDAAMEPDFRGTPSDERTGSNKGFPATILGGVHLGGSPTRGCEPEQTGSPVVRNDAASPVRSDNMEGCGGDAAVKSSSATPEHHAIAVNAHPRNITRDESRTCANTLGANVGGNPATRSPCNHPNVVGPKNERLADKKGGGRMVRADMEPEASGETPRDRLTCSLLGKRPVRGDPAIPVAPNYAASPVRSDEMEGCGGDAAVKPSSAFPAHPATRADAATGADADLRNTTRDQPRTCNNTLGIVTGCREELVGTQNPRPATEGGDCMDDDVHPNDAQNGEIFFADTNGASYDGVLVYLTASVASRVVRWGYVQGPDRKPAPSSILNVHPRPLYTGVAFSRPVVCPGCV